jgi:hypothetical protein
VSAIYVVDTSYLLEFYRVPGSSTEEGHAEVTRRWDAARNEGARFYVTVGCILELGNHVAKCKTRDRRRELAEELAEDVGDSVEHGIPWEIVPADQGQALAIQVRAFRDRWVAQRVGLVDVQTIEQAKRLNRDYHARGHRVHIWTTDKALKACEPDAEPNRFTG